MGEKINKEYEDFQKYLSKKEKKLKLLVGFELDENIEEVIKELNNKEIVS
jgi:basic membrane lipoprotein Med (substrate-binding protein (PBP1-ABC) superfamily)